MRTRSQQGFVIDESRVPGSFEYDNAVTPLTMYVGNLQVAHKNKRARGYMRVDFQVDRWVWHTEKVVFDLGGFALDNVLNQANVYC